MLLFKECLSVAKDAISTVDTNGMCDNILFVLLHTVELHLKKLPKLGKNLLNKDKEVVV